MRLIQYLKEKRIIIGTTWAIITTVLSLYLAFYPIEKKPKLTLFQLDKFDVFNVDSPIDELQILINGKDISREEMGLKVYRFKMINEGESDIREIDYDKNSPFGLGISNGTLVRVNINKQKWPGLYDNLLNIETNDSNFITFNKVFIGKRDYAFLDLWVKHKRGEEPFLFLSGKIAETEMSITEKEEISESTFEVIVLPFLYLGGFLLAIWLFFVIPVFILNRLQYAFRWLHFKYLFQPSYDRTNKSHRLLLQFYSKYGKKIFTETLRIIVDANAVNQHYTKEVEKREIVEHFLRLPDYKHETKEIEPYLSEFLELIAMLEQVKLLTFLEDGRISIKEEFNEESQLALKLV